MLLFRKQHYQDIQSINVGFEKSVLIELKLKVIHTNVHGLWYTQTGMNTHTFRQGECCLPDQ